MSTKKIFSWVIVCLLVLQIMPLQLAASQAGPANAGFEDDLMGWTTYGNVTIGSGDNYIAGSNTWTVNPYESKMAVLVPSGVSGAFPQAAEVLGLSDDSRTYITSRFPNITNAAYIYTTISLAAGESFSMAWNYVATDYDPFNDASFVSLVNLTNPAIVPIINGYAAEVGILGATVLGTGNYSTGDYGSTGWQTVTIQAVTAGEYRLGFTVFNLGDLILSPYLFVDQNPGTTLKNGEPFGAIAPDTNAPPPPVSDFQIFYNGNGHTGGTAPEDTAKYQSGDFATVLGNTGSLEKDGFTFNGWNTQADGSGTNYAPDSSITVASSIILYANWVSDGEEPVDIPQPPPPPQANIVVNGTTHYNTADVSFEINLLGQLVITVMVPESKIKDALNNLPEGTDNPVIGIPWSAGGGSVVCGQLNGQMVRDMEDKDAIIEVITGSTIYSLPAKNIQIDSISGDFGDNIKLSDITVQIVVAALTAEQLKFYADAAHAGQYVLVVPPVAFTVTCIYQGKTVQVEKFNSYVQRLIAIPEGVDPQKITTGVVLAADGTLRHVPTKIIIKDGRYYAQINSLTNSIYSVIWNPLEYMDVEGHWAKDAINDTGSRIVVDGMGGSHYNPDATITRLEFVEFLVNALGLPPGEGSASFKDSSGGYLSTAMMRKLVCGFADGTFRPDAPLTREQAAVLIYRAMDLTGLRVKLSKKPVNLLIASYSDSSQTAAYAKDALAACMETGIINGRSAKQLAPKAHLTRAEAATMIRRLLQASNLI